jgi:hypothetical protein
MTSIAAFARALYSASVLDLETIACFRALQEMRLALKYTANPHVLRLSSGQPAQSASVKVLANVDEFRKIRPKLRVPLMYRRIRLIAA